MQLKIAANKIKGHAAMRGLTLSALAAELGVSNGYLFDLIRNRRTLGDYPERIAAILQVSLAEICEEEKAA